MVPAPWTWWSSAVTVMAPEFTIGLNGRLVIACSSIELKASPLGSTPTCRATGLEHPALGGDERDPEAIRVRARELGDVGRHYAVVVRHVLRVQAVEQYLHLVGRRRLHGAPLVANRVDEVVM